MKSRVSFLSVIAVLAISGIVLAQAKHDEKKPADKPAAAKPLGSS